MVSVRADDHLSDRLAEIKNEHGAVDIDELAEQWQSTRWTPQSMILTPGSSANASSYTRTGGNGTKRSAIASEGRTLK